MMEGCEFCSIIEKKLNMVYEDSQIYVMHAPKPASSGHMLVLPKQHWMIIEQIPDYEVSEIFEKVNKISTAVFEAAGAQGTNIIVQNGVAAGQSSSHFIIHVIPRREGDGLSLSWQPRQIGDDEMSTVELKLKDAAKDIGSFEKRPAKPVEEKKEPEKMIIDERRPDSAENYLIKQLERLP